MANERKKLRNVRREVGEMDADGENREEFERHLGNFMKSAREVMIYAEREATGHLGGQIWYQEWMGRGMSLETTEDLRPKKIREKKPKPGPPFSTKLTMFFKDLRDTEVHLAPIQPSAHFSFHVTTSVPVATSVAFEVIRANGGREIHQGSPLAPPPTIPSTTHQDPTQYRFIQLIWNSQEPIDVVTLCRMYIDELNAPRQ